MQVAETSAAWWPGNLWYSMGKGDRPEFLLDGDTLGHDARVGDLFAAWDGRMGDSVVVQYWFMGKTTMYNMRVGRALADLTRKQATRRACS